jgi:hypothetical protein
MATEEDRVTVRTPLTEFAKRVLRAWPQRALADSVALAAQGNERMVAAMPAGLKIADLQSCRLRDPCPGVVEEQQQGVFVDSNEGGHLLQSDRGHHSNLMAAS